MFWVLLVGSEDLHFVSFKFERTRGPSSSRMATSQKRTRDEHGEVVEVIDGVFKNLAFGTEDLVLDVADGQDFFLDDVDSQGLAGSGRVDPGQEKEALFRREALDDSWTREGRAHVCLERRFMVMTFDFLGWGVFVDRCEPKATRVPSRSGLVALASREPEAVTLVEDRGTAQRARAACRDGPVRDALHGDGGKRTAPRRRSR